MGCKIFLFLYTYKITLQALKSHSFYPISQSLETSFFSFFVFKEGGPWQAYEGFSNKSKIFICDFEHVLKVLLNTRRQKNDKKNEKKKKYKPPEHRENIIEGDI